MQPLTRKHKKSEIGTGGHLVVISDMFILMHNKIAQLIDGFPAITVQFKTGKNKLHEQTYVMDKSFRQKYFVNMLNAAQVDTTKGTPKKSDAVSKRLWIFIQEIHYVNDEIVVKDETGNAIIDFQIFKVYPFIEGGKKPVVKGDPEITGIASEDFVTYKNVSEEYAPPAAYVAAKSIVKVVEAEKEKLFDSIPDAPDEYEEEALASDPFAPKDAMIDNPFTDEEHLPENTYTKAESPSPADEDLYDQVPNFEID